MTDIREIIIIISADGACATSLDGIYNVYAVALVYLLSLIYLV